MDKKDDNRARDNGSGKGKISVVGIGPGAIDQLTGRAKEAIALADCVVGYTRYVALIAELCAGKEVYTSGMTHEVERCAKAVEFAAVGRRVVVVSSGDSGIYGMAGLVMQLALKESNGLADVEVIPGVPAFVASAALLGAPLMHDFASISLSDLLTPWPRIQDRLEAAAKADFVTIFYNPKSSKRTDGLRKAVEIIGAHRAASTPVGIVRNATRKGEEAVVTTIGNFDRYYDSIDMLTIIIIGNSQTFVESGRMITPRGYAGV